MSKLDLHGVRHQDVDLMVENFIYLNQDKFPIEIICGNSIKMIELVKKVAERIGCQISMYRYGVVIIERWK